MLLEAITKRELSYRDAADEILAASGTKVLRFSVYQWAHGVSKPNLKNARAILAWDSRISLASWEEAPRKAAEKKEKAK